jgi:hypothetical protein
MKKVPFSLLLLLCAVGFRAWAGEPDAPIEWSFTGELNLAPHVFTGEPDLYDRLHTGFRYSYDFFTLVADMSLIGDEKYEPAERFMFGRYFYIHNGGVILDFGPLSLKAGRFVHRDIVDTPYSLFVSSYDPFFDTTGLSALLADISFRGGPFTYESRWIDLNTRSDQGYPDRGANYKVFALQLGDFRFGLQDVAVYVDRSFDLEYFLSPIPHIFTQMFTSMDGTPWLQTGNDNSITGLFFEWLRPESYLYAQWLVDDISLDALIPQFLRDWFPEVFGSTAAASKMAWSLGGRYEFPFGTLGFYHAGATKYTFEATNDVPQYGYTYYPASEYLQDGVWVELDYRDNYIGYLYGENNLAFLADYAYSFPRLDVGASLEYVISGSKSPANPWHDATGATDAGRYTQMFGEPVLEHTVAARIQAAWRVRSWTLYGRLRLGGVFNRLGLESAVDDGGDPQRWIYRPQAGDNRLIYGLTVGATYTAGIGKARRPGPD